ncbi:PIN2/TERF1-interacting telomerase inhibitor 1-like [Styela clava]|uniref:PIN2/TERF1-interacting telomerase inhibitor 1-like n=1 Tax=Styela clava TaxID=7725 RepID=UPI00193AA06F|nr:PIN2/TERF1-interacting telomerase inhibitor 1-like [Styela clava]
MSMLAESRDKKKWSIDPNGTNWSKDENKFGVKMLERMGWTKGKGLGANEDGRIAHIKIKHKNDNRGVGCSIKQEQNWVAHQDDFADLLAQLNNHHSDQTDVKNMNGVSSLEKKSKSQKRVHYHKFARGKDLSNYKETDLAAIFGKTASKSEPVTPINLSEDEISDADSTSSCPESKKKKKSKKKKTTEKESPKNNATNHVTSTISVQEYFALRMAAIKKKASSPSVASSPSEEDSTIDTTTAQEEKAVTATDNDSTVDSTNKIKKKKKSKKVEDSETTEPAEADKTLKRKKKSKLKSIDTKKDSNKMESSNNSDKKVKRKSKKRKNKDLQDDDLNLSTNKFKKKKTE